MTTNLDLYFVPMSTVGLASDAALAAQADGAAAELVALLFVPSAPPGSGTGQSDFERLGRALLTWALNGFASGPEPASVSFDQLDALVGKPTSPRQRTLAEIQGFLAGQFTFTLKGPKALSASLSLALFPMFPSLQLSTGDGKRSVDFGTYKMASPAFQQFVAGYFGKLAVDVGGQPSGSGGGAASPQAESLATSVFADYFQLVWRQVVGDATTWLRRQTSKTTTLDALASAGVLNNAAGFASRFLLHGLRLPDPDQGVPAPGAWTKHPLYPLFTLTGQQWAPVFDAKTTSYTLTLKPGAAAAPPALLPSNMDATHAFTIDLTDLELDPKNYRDGLELLGDYQKVLAGNATDPLGIEGVLGTAAPIDPYVQTGKRFPLSGRVAWQSKLVPSFSDPLRTQIAAYLAGGATSADLRLGAVSPSDPPSKATVWLDPSAFTWTTRLDFSVRRATDPGGSGQPVPSTYEIRGADQDDRHDLFTLLTYLQNGSVAAGAFTVDVAYAGDDGVLLSDASPAILLVRANLSTGTTAHDARPLAAAELDGVDHSVDQQANYRTDFLTLLWESSVTDTGGYYLYYRKSDGTGLPDRLFTEGPSATLTVLVTLTGPGPVRPFHNAAVCSAAVADDAVFLVEPGPGAQIYPGWLTRRAVLPPGNAGVKLTRSPPANPLAAVDQLATMFNLLGVWLEDAGGFTESPEGLPVGPVQSDDATALPDPKAPWIYQRIVGIAPFAKSPGGSAAFPGPSPYAGVGDLVRLGFLWHDLFGNRLVSDAHARSLDIPIRYRDPLLPLGQWPGASVSYSFGASRALTLALGFVPTRYTPAGAQATLDRARADGARYRQIYFQLAQADVSAWVTCTADDAAEHALPKGDLLAFVIQARAYADAVLAGGALPAAPALTLSVTLGAGSPAAVIFPLVVQVILRRDAALVDASFTAEPGVTSVASAVRPLLTAADGDPLGLVAFAQAFEALFPLKLASGTLDDSGQLYAVELQSSKLGYALPSTPAPHFFAPRPLSVVPWSATDVPIVPYASGQPLDPATAVKKSFRGIDLDTWGRDFLRDVDRMLSAQYAIAFHQRDPASYRTLLDAKERLADAVEETVTEILAGNAGGDLPAAREALRQKLLLSLSEAYLVDAIVQLPITVTSPADAALSPPPGAPTTAADAVLRLSFDPKGIIPVPPNATLASLGTLFGVPVELITALVADNAALLVPKKVIAYQGKSHTVAPGESLRDVARALGASVDVQDLAAAIASTPGLLLAGASLDLVKRVYTVAAGDTLRTVLDLLAPEIMASGDPGDAIADFLDVNHALAGVFAGGVKFHVNGQEYVASAQSSLDDLAAQVGLPAADLVTALLDIPSLLAPSVVLGFVSALPGHTLSRAQVDVPGGGPASRQEPLTFLLETASHAHFSNLGLSLSFQLSQLEYDISTPAPWAGGYEESDWLSFVLPPGGSVGLVDIPIPLRAYPATPTVDHHGIVQALPPSPTLAQIRAYSYQFVYTYSRAAQDEMSLSVTYNRLSLDEGDAGDAAAAAIPDLAQRLAQYAAIAAALSTDLALLATVPPGDTTSDAAKRAHNAVLVFAAQADAIASAWKTWKAPLPASFADVTHVVAHSLDAAGNPQVVVTSKTPDAAHPTVTPAGHVPSFQHRGDAHTLAVFQPAADGGDAPRADQFEYDTPPLDVLAQQSAWGSVGITRNHALVGDGTTSPEFIYRIADVRFYSAAVPLVTYRAPFDLASVKTRLSPAPPTKLRALLANFFAELLGITDKSQATGGPGVRTAVSYGTLLAGAPSASAGASSNIVSLLPVLLSPVATFNPQVDLLQPGGLCDRLASAMNDFIARNKPATRGARWVLDVSVYTSLVEDGKQAQRPPLLELTDVQLALADAT